MFHLVKVPLLLIQVGSQAIGSLNINHEVLHLSLQPLLGLLQRGTLGVGGLNGLLSFLKTLSQLLPVDTNHDIAKMFCTDCKLGVVDSNVILR